MWVLLVRAVLVLGLGVAFLLSGTIRPVLGNLIAFYWLIGALVTLHWVRTNRGIRGLRLATAAGFLGVISAVVVLARSLIADVISTDAVLSIGRSPPGWRSANVTATTSGSFAICCSSLAYVRARRSSKAAAARSYLAGPQ